jgi:hypothetical protein
MPAGTVFLAAGRTVVGDKQRAAGGAEWIRGGFLQVWFHAGDAAGAGAGFGQMPGRADGEIHCGAVNACEGNAGKA